MKKVILASVVVLILLGIALWVFMPSHKRKVADFSVFPCEINKADTVQIETGDQRITLGHVSGDWRIVKPVAEELDWGAYQAFGAFWASKIFVDEKHEINPEEKQRLSKQIPTFVEFIQKDKTLCRLELGQGIKLPTVDSERRWVFMDNMAYRTFIPLMDYGQLLEQPVAGWRVRTLEQLTTSSIEGIRIRTQSETFNLDRNGKKTEKNPQGWQMVSAQKNDQPLRLDDFELDERRVATVVDLVTPFMVDEWADFLTDSEKAAIEFGGTLEITANKKDYAFEIGSLVDFNQHPEYAWTKEGARYVREKGKERIGILTSQRLAGIFPGLDDMRTKNVWKLDSSVFSAIEVKVGDACMRYAASGPNVWSGSACPENEAPASESQSIHPETLGNYVKTLTSLQAARYVTEEESAQVSLNEAEIRIYENADFRLAHVLRMGQTVRDIYRFGRVDHVLADGSTENGPIFVLPEQIARYLLTDLTQAVEH
jgi:hypothetical protein